LRLFVLMAIALMWGRPAEIALARTAGDESGFSRTKLNTARFFMQRVLPQSSALFSCIVAGGKSIMDFDDDDF